MSNRKHQVAVDKHQAKDVTLKLIVGGKPETYEEFYTGVDFADDDQPNVRAVKEWINAAAVPVFIYTLSPSTETPIIIDFDNNTIKKGSAAAVAIGTDLSVYQSNPDIKFKLIIDAFNSRPIGNDGWISNEKYSDGSYAVLSELTLQPDTDTGFPGGFTRDYINIIIKP
jgi:hypothetical protein